MVGFLSLRLSLILFLFFHKTLFYCVLVFLNMKLSLILILVKWFYCAIIFLVLRLSLILFLSTKKWFYCVLVFLNMRLSLLLILVIPCKLVLLYNCFPHFEFILNFDFVFPQINGFTLCLFSSV